MFYLETSTFHPTSVKLGDDWANCPSQVSSLPYAQSLKYFWWSGLRNSTHFLGLVLGAILQPIILRVGKATTVNSDLSRRLFWWTSVFRVLEKEQEESNEERLNITKCRTRCGVLDVKPAESKTPHANDVGCRRPKPLCCYNWRNGPTHCLHRRMSPEKSSDPPSTRLLTGFRKLN